MSSMGNLFRSDRARRRRAGASRADSGHRLNLLLEMLEGRQLMTATPMAIETISWNERSVEVKDDSYIFRIDATNKASASNLAQMRFTSPALESGWSAKSLGYGYYSLSAPGTSLSHVQAWATRVGVAALEPNFIVSNSIAKTGIERPSLERSQSPNASDIQSTTSRLIAAVDPNLPSQWALTKIEAQAAWAKTRGSSNVIVAVMSSGIQADHPDLAANMWTRPGIVPAAMSGVNGYDFANDDDVPEDTIGTGTAMAGVIGAVGGNDTGAQGISGVSPTVRLYAAKVDERATQQAIDTTIAAMLRIVQLKTEYFQPFEVVVAANSTTRLESAVEREAIRMLSSVGILYVVHAGDANDDPNSGGSGLDLDTTPSFPSNYSEVLDNVLTVAATTSGDEKRLESRHGNDRIVQIAAPGDQILTTLPGGVFGTRSGTAMAAAHVAGVAALLKAYGSDARMPDVKKALLDGADKVSALEEYVIGGRRLNASKALDVLKTTPVAPGDGIPTVTVSNVSVIEGHSGISTVGVTFRLDQPAAANRPVSVSYATSNQTAFAGRDFIGQSGLVSFRGFELEKTVQFRIVGNTRPDLDRSFNVVLNQAKSQNVRVLKAPQNVATVTIQDDDQTVPAPPTQGTSLQPRLSVTPRYAAGATKVAEGDVATFDVILSRASDKTVSVRYRTADVRTQANSFATPHADYQPVAGTLVFKPGELRKTITVTTIADTLNDEDERIDIVLFQPVNAALGGSTPAFLGVAPPPPPPPGASGFTITVVFPDSSLTTSQKAAFNAAAARWSEIIVGDLPDVVDNGVTIDDVMILATALPLDGGGGLLGQAGPTALRSGSKGLPYKGIMEFDITDLARIEADGRLNALILHEMAHVLGVGTIWEPFGLLVGAGSANPIFTGANAVREYNAIFGTTATGVPVENTGGPGTRDGHWRESIFRTEIMTGWLERVGTPMPISRVTVGQFQDLGYRVDFSKADDYTKPAASAPATREALSGAVRLIRAGAGIEATPAPVARRQISAVAVAASLPPIAKSVSGRAMSVSSALGAVPSAIYAWPKVTAARPAETAAKMSFFAVLGSGHIDRTSVPANFLRPIVDPPGVCN